MNAARLFRLPASASKDPAIGNWFRAQRADLSAIALTWFDQMRRCGPDVREVMHDDCPVACVGDVAFAYVNAFTSHVNVGFFHGADLDDPGALLEGTGKYMRHIKLRPDCMMDAVAIGNLIEDAYLDIKRRIDEAERERNTG
jgi:hypothetical protein